jgi:hypothetical protein
MNGHGYCWLGEYLRPRCSLGLQYMLSQKLQSGTIGLCSLSYPDRIDGPSSLRIITGPQDSIHSG